MKRKDLVPLKAVTDEMGVSRVTLWRALKSNIPGLPAPTIIRRLVYWKRDELDRLEEALLRYQGRVKFERDREAERRIARLRKDARPVAKRGAVAPDRHDQLDLFETRVVTAVCKG